MSSFLLLLLLLAGLFNEDIKCYCSPAFKSCRPAKTYFPGGDNPGKSLPPVKVLPVSWNWGNAYGINFLSEIKNEHVPRYCRGCWAFAPLSAITDRFSIKYNNKFPQVNLSPQILINCMDKGSCNGGNPKAVYPYISKKGVPNESCQNYQGKKGNCPVEAVCTKCQPETTRSIRDVSERRLLYKISNYGSVIGVENMKNEICQRGPISCGIQATPSFINYKGENIFSEKRLLPIILNHEVSVTGWGNENETDFWHVRSSWGSYWGDKGFAKIMMYKNNLGLETDCSWGLPTNLGYDASNTTCVHQDRSNLAHRSSPKSQSFCDPNYLDYREINGSIDFTTIIRNQNSPKNSSFSWAMAVASSLSDRINIARNRSFPQINLSPQVLVNCVACNGTAKDCVSKAHSWLNDSKTKIPDDSCTNYVAEKQDCTPEYTCRNCDSSGACSAVTEYPMYQVKECGEVHGIDDMKQEICSRGPITCEIAVDDRLENYCAGIIHSIEKREVSHLVSVAGWGSSNEDHYWIVRNSWGEQWGWNGWFKVTLGNNSYGIENNCFWGWNDDWKKL